jgi:DNA-binding IclR family transcriptional regulator
MTVTKKDTEKYKIPAVQKAFAILELFAQDNQPRSLSEVSRIFGLPVSTTSSLLNTIVSCGYLGRNDRGAYSLTTKLLAQSNNAVGQAQLLEVSRPAMKELTDSTGLTSVLAVQESYRLVWIDKVDGSNDIRLAAQVGKLMHPHHTSSGKAILAYLPEAEFLQIVKVSGLPKFTPKTITSIRELKRELEKVRAQGYAVDDGETAVGIRGIGAPIFDSGGHVIASVAIGGTLFDFESKMKKMIPRVKAAADKISESLGYNHSSRKQVTPD